MTRKKIKKKKKKRNHKYCRWIVSNIKVFLSESTLMKKRNIFAFDLLIENL